MSRRVLQLSVGLAAIVAMAYGLMSGEAMAVWRKAAYLCLECIGLG